MSLLENVILRKKKREQGNFAAGTFFLISGNAKKNHLSLFCSLCLEKILLPREMKPFQ